MVGRFDQDAHLGSRGLIGIEDAHLVIGQLDFADRRVETFERLAYGIVQSIDRTIALGGGDFLLVADADLDHGGGVDAIDRRLIDDNLVILEFEEWRVLAEDFPDDQLE